MAAFTTDQARGALHEFGRGRWDVLVELANDGPADGIAATLLAGIGLEESHLRNVVGDGGHGRGCMQIDDRSHQSFLRSHAGCKDGTWTVSLSAKSGGALAAGYVPPLVAAVSYAQGLLRANWQFGLAHGVKESHLKQFAVAAYNCGAGNALRSYQEGGIRAIDKRTANGHYSADVLGNQRAVAAAVDELGWT